MPYKRRRTRRVYCAVCGNEFEAAKLEAMYCSDACKMKAYRNRRSKIGNEAKHQPGRVKEPKRNNLKSCPHCGERFRAERSDKKYCSASCRVVANRNKQARTLSKLKREGDYTDYALYQIVDLHGWSFLYKLLVRLGFEYSDTRETWVSTNAPDWEKML